MSSPSHHHIPFSVWGMLLLLSVIWGGSYLFVGIAVKDLSPLVIVMARVVIAAAALLPLHFLLVGPAAARPGGVDGHHRPVDPQQRHPLHADRDGQTMIASGLASVINATSPLFGVAFIAAAGLEPLIPRKVLGILIGIVGVAILKGGTLLGEDSQSLGILLCLGAAASYGAGSLWAKLKLKGTPPLSMATGQLLCSSANHDGSRIQL